MLLRSGRITLSRDDVPKADVIKCAEPHLQTKPKYPKVGEVVMVNIRSTAEMGIRVVLLEYNLIEGLLPYCKLFGRSPVIGNNECAIVIDVDTKYGYIDLSKRGLTKSNVQACRENYDRLYRPHAIKTL